MAVSGQRHAPAAVYPGRRTPGTHWIGGWVCLRAGLDSEAKSNTIIILLQMLPCEGGLATGRLPVQGILPDGEKGFGNLTKKAKSQSGHVYTYKHTQFQGKLIMPIFSSKTEENSHGRWNLAETRIAYFRNTILERYHYTLH
jgi:hypothetical protein